MTTSGCKITGELSSSPRRISVFVWGAECRLPVGGAECSLSSMFYSWHDPVATMGDSRP